jgi:hypothetical protein
MILQGVDVVVAAGIVLLAVAALTGFMVARVPAHSELHALWRVVHNGGTAGGVQLIALGVAADKFGATRDPLTLAILFGVALATWAFFIGPLLRVLGRPGAARVTNAVGAIVATPAYAGLPLLLFR